MKIKAHPTKYKDVTFRSRLEATWAAFFDLAGIKWQYEPIDLEGWVPDFVLWLSSPVYVEVKPAPMEAMWPKGPVVLNGQFDGFDKAKKHWKDAWVLCVGIQPNEDADYFGLGMLMDHGHGEQSWFDMLDQLRVQGAANKWAAAKSVTQWVTG